MPGGMPGGVPGQENLSSGQYEFGPYESVAIDKMGSRTRVWGIFSLIMGVLMTLGLLGFAVVLATKGGKGAAAAAGIIVAGFPFAIVQLATGYFYFTAGDRLREVHATQGADVEHLMHGLQKLTHAFRIEVIVTAITLVLGLLAGLVVFAMTR